MMAVSLLAGTPDILLWLDGGGALWLYCCWGEPLTMRRVVPGCWQGGLALMVALGIGAIQLLPSLRLSGESVRSAVVTKGEPVRQPA